MQCDTRFSNTILHCTVLEYNTVLYCRLYTFRVPWRHVLRGVSGLEPHLRLESAHRVAEQVVPSGETQPEVVEVCVRPALINTTMYEALLDTNLRDPL